MIRRHVTYSRVCTLWSSQLRQCSNNNNNNNNNDENKANSSSTTPKTPSPPQTPPEGSAPTSKSSASRMQKIIPLDIHFHKYFSDGSPANTDNTRSKAETSHLHLKPPTGANVAGQAKLSFGKRVLLYGGQGFLLAFLSYYVYDRWYGSGKVVSVPEIVGMQFLTNPTNEVSKIYITTSTREAYVVLPQQHVANGWFWLNPAPPASGGEGAAPPAHQTHLKFHVSDFSRFDLAMQMVGAPRPVCYDYHVEFPWVPFLMLMFIPILGTINARYKVARMAANVRGGFGIGSSKEGHFKLQQERPNLGFKDIAGMSEPKNEVKEVVDFLMSPEKFQRLGATVPKGIMLSGIPGVGKTMLAKAVAGEARCNFISCAGSEFVEIYVGVGASRVRELFQTAKQAAPCVIFIDEIDAFAKSRKMGDKSGGGGGSEGDNTINALLSEMDGFHNTNGIVVMAGTNRVDILDEALMRPGRFDRKIAVDAPPLKDRIEIFNLHLAPLLLSPGGPGAKEAFASKLAGLTPGNTGADIKNICNESAIIAARENKPGVDMECFIKGLERVQIGLKRQSKVLTESERRRAAAHEAGHAVVNWHMKYSEPLCKITIVQYAGDRMSVNQRMPADKYIRTQAELDDRMCDMLGGLVAEDFLLGGDISSSAAEDLHNATLTAYNYVARFGMCPDTIGHFSFPDPGEKLTIQKPFGSKLEKDLDKAVGEIVSAARKRAEAILKEHDNEVRVVMGLLLKQESLTARDLTLALGPRECVSKELDEFLTT